MVDVLQEIEGVRRENPDTRVDCYVLFESHTDAMQLYELVRAAGIGARISATPRQARACCGVALLVSCDDAESVMAVADGAHAAYESIVALPNQINPHRDVYC